MCICIWVEFRTPVLVWRFFSLAPDCVTRAIFANVNTPTIYIKEEDLTKRSRCWKQLYMYRQHKRQYKRKRLLFFFLFLLFYTFTSPIYGFYRNGFWAQDLVFKQVQILLPIWIFALKETYISSSASGILLP